MSHKFNLLCFIYWGFLFSLLFFFFSFLGGSGGPEKDRDSSTAMVLRLAIVFYSGEFSIGGRFIVVVRWFSIGGHSESSSDGSV